MIEDALAAVDKAGVKLQVGFVRRYSTTTTKVRDTVASGMLGAPSIVKVTSRDPAPTPMYHARKYPVVSSWDDDS